MSDDSEMRCTDKQLFQLCVDFNKHVVRFDAHIEAEERKFDRLVEAQLQNTTEVSNLTKQVSSLVADTSDIIKLHKDIQGASRLGRGFQNFILWFLKWGVIASVVLGVAQWWTEHFKG